MKLPAVLDGFSPESGEDLLHSTSLAVLGAFLQEKVIEDLELAYGYEDLPLLDELAVVLRARMGARLAGRGPDVPALQRGFVHAFLSGLDIAAQLHLRNGDGLHLDASLNGVFDGRVQLGVREPLDAAALELAPVAENAFITFQDHILKAVASTRDTAMLLDFWATGCLWAALAGVEAGLQQAPEPV